MSYHRHNGYQTDDDLTVGLCDAGLPPRDDHFEGVAMVTVFLVDDHEVVRRGLIDLLEHRPRTRRHR